MVPDHFRPLTLGELLDATFSLYRRHVWLFAGIAAVPAVTVLPSSLIAQLMAPTSPAVSGAAPGPSPLDFMFVGLIGFNTILYALTAALAFGASTLAISEIYLGRATSWGDAFSGAWAHFGRLLWMFVLIGVRMGAFVAAVGLGSVIITFMSSGSALALVPMILAVTAGGIVAFVMLLRYSVAVPVLVLEDQAAREALRRSATLTGGSLGRLFAVTLLWVVLSYITFLVFQAPFFAAALFMPAGGVASTVFGAAAAVSGSIGSALSMPLMQIAGVLIYYDLRVRKEGFDLQLLLADLDQVPGASGAMTVQT